ncbi:hypothetical protein PCE1_000215 [Barthelona sp. PCE]
MIAAQIRNHIKEQEKEEVRLEEVRSDCYSKAGKFTRMALNQVNQPAAVVFNNQKTIQANLKKLEGNLGEFTTTVTELAQAVSGFNAAIKSLEHIDTWALSIQTDMRDVAEVLEQINT